MSIKSRERWPDTHFYDRKCCLRCLNLTQRKKKKKKYGSNNLLHEQFGKRNQGFCKRLSCQMSFTNVHNEFKTKLRKTSCDFIVHSSDVTLHSSQFILHSSHFTLPSFLKWLNIYEPLYDKINNVAVRSAKTQISLGIHAILLVLSWDI